ncbi:hypothetical protein QW131_05635 [Roseibium salinum]|nr:hypothetical protein [Roseibium salinum]
MSDGGRKPLKAALHTFAAFVACGSVPLLPFVLAFQASATTASALTAVAFFSRSVHSARAGLKDTGCLAASRRPPSACWRPASPIWPDTDCSRYWVSSRVSR